MSETRTIALTEAQLRELYYYLLLPRRIEERMLRLLRQGKLAKWFSGIGQEAISVGATYALQPDDVILPLHRNLGVFTTRGVDLKRLLRQLMGKAGGFTKGRDRTFHFGVPEHRIIGMISHLGAMLPVADGLALAFQLRNERRVALAFIGEGGTSEGDFHEALNLAAVWKLPVVFLVENNGYALSTPTREQYACERLADRALGYGMEGFQVDGNDVLAVYEAVRYAAEKARQGDGPTLIEALTFRMRGHEEASGTQYVPPELFAVWAERDPLLLFTRRLEAEGVLTEADKAAIESRIQSQIEEAVQDALTAPWPESTPERELADVYAPSPPPTAPPTGPAPERRYIDAISEALWQAMEADPKVLLLGQDIAEYGGVFKVTQGFVERFGKARVRNTPIIESGAVGAALGLALEGFKPVVEMQFADFVSCAFNQIVNNLAKTHYRWGAPVNVTIRLPAGGGTAAGPFHSQNPEAWFLHVPGLKIVAPATPWDAKGLLLAAIEDPNPVLYVEHKLLYRSLKGPVPESRYTIPIGRAQIQRPGRDLSIISYGLGTHWALELAERLAEEGVELEVIDLRSLLPWDKELVLESVRRTNRALLLHEANLTGGVGAEIAATIAQEAFRDLDAPVYRVASLDTPIPFSENLERHVYWPKDRLPEAVWEVLRF
ncbi:MAG: dehydrogenase E1 component subunit alpha/beta [Bacteroidetes bacterium]|nr:dehydrogenase E1 component subunit alpha/beta [Rhodothermia bacterium]MCS7155269.1 dehydrogenase E1 component subunit alpha/beta [Bacteroidota bacterium]MCX7907854.1 dehydrogenase E1 component subunit alpha/beta [Bacteroidota bacterium]MDW8138673.1 dehydrogenase E1 component subunit alpha/beta [Bacteroidota bacterium]MDW8284741.1 dehydrogenase E1 component subunit alpha/beta [Bacteroidota bacterium]